MAVIAGAIVGGIIPACSPFPSGCSPATSFQRPSRFHSGSASFKAKKVANKAIDRDIDNGTLVLRYQMEALDKLTAAKTGRKNWNFFNRKSKKNSPDASKTATPGIKRYRRIKP